MRIWLLLLALSAPLAAHAESLRLDDDTIKEAQRLLAMNQTASSSLPALLDELAAANHSGSSEGPGILNGVGVGLQVGTPTALTFKFASGGNANIVLGIGAFFDYRGGYFGGLSLHGDYLFTLATLVNNGTIDLSAYAGPGVWVNLFNGVNAPYGLFGGGYYYFGGVSFIGIAGRVPLGLNLRFSAAPIEIYLELDPALFVFPGVDFFIGASLGFRWFF